MTATMRDLAASTSDRASIFSPGHFDGRNIALIGNSVRIFEREDGNEIDDHEFVIRFNLAWPANARKPQCTGRKTTHMMIGGREFRETEAAAQFARTIEGNPKVSFFSAKGDPAKWTLTSPVPLLPDNIYQDWREANNTNYGPTSGAALIFYLLRYNRPNAIALFGMDGLKSRVWYKQQRQVHAASHSAEVEARYLKQVVDETPFLTIAEYD